MRYLLLLALLLLAAPAFANTAPPPDKFEVESPNGNWVIKANRREPEQRICRAGSDETVWKFDVDRAYDNFFFLSNDGATVALVGKWWVKANETGNAGVKLLRKTGIVAEFTVDQFAPKLDKTGADSLQWLHEVDQSGDIVIVKCVDGTLSRVSLTEAKLKGQETFEVPQESGTCTTTPALSYAFAGGAALLALLTLLIALRQLHARGSQARG
jgi:hypothetical protein